MIWAGPQIALSASGQRGWASGRHQSAGRSRSPTVADPAFTGSHMDGGSGLIAERTEALGAGVRPLGGRPLRPDELRRVEPARGAAGCELNSVDRRDRCRGTTLLPVRSLHTFVTVGTLDKLLVRRLHPGPHVRLDAHAASIARRSAPAHRRWRRPGVRWHSHETANALGLCKAERHGRRCVRSRLRRSRVVLLFHGSHYSDGRWPPVSLRRAESLNSKLVGWLVVVTSLAFCSCVACGAFDDGETELTNASFSGDIVRVRALLEEGADPNEPSALWTPLGVAADDAGSNDIVVLLLDAGADPNLSDPSGLRPLTRAMRFNAPDNVRTLLAAGAEVDYQDSDESSPCDLAREMDDPQPDILRQVCR